MKELVALLVGLTFSAGCFANATSTTQLICSVKNVHGEGTANWEVTLDEEAGTVTVNSSWTFPAIFSSASVVWETDLQTGGGSAPSRIDRYSGALTVASTKYPGRIVLSGTCSPASDMKRKF